jgi:hypothetical protein
MWPFSKRYGGLVAGHHLEKWWGGLSRADRDLLLQVTSQPFSAFIDFDSGPARTLQTTKAMLASLADWFKRDDLRRLGHKIMAHAEALPHDSADALDLHFMLNGMIGFYYRCRNDGPDFIIKCEDACREMISIAPLAATAFLAKFPRSPLPNHLGYGRLCWLLEKRGDPEGARLRLEGEKAGWRVTI